VGFLLGLFIGAGVTGITWAIVYARVYAKPDDGTKRLTAGDEYLAGVLNGEIQPNQKVVKVIEVTKDGAVWRNENGNRILLADRLYLDPIPAVASVSPGYQIGTFRQVVRRGLSSSAVLPTYPTRITLGANGVYRAYWGLPGEDPTWYAGTAGTQQAASTIARMAAMAYATKVLTNG
jgi:hypothetical protein